MPLVEQIPHRPWTQRGHVVDGEFRWRLGTHSLDLADWFEWGSDGQGWVDEKPGIMRDHADVAFAALDDIDSEAQEVAAAIAQHVDAELDTSLHPLDAAARLVPDDLVVMVERDGRLVFGGGSVCFPNRWDLCSKIGQTMGEVHAPVSQLNDQLESAIDNFFDRLAPERSYWRLGWGLIDSPHGFEPPLPQTPNIEIGSRSGQRRQRAVAPEEDDIYVRVERETLRRFPITDAVLFTIRTYIAPITSLHRDDRTLVARTVEAMRPDVRAYKDVTLR